MFDPITPLRYRYHHHTTAASTMTPPPPPSPRYPANTDTATTPPHQWHTATTPPGRNRHTATTPPDRYRHTATTPPGRYSHRRATADSNTYVGAPPTVDAVAWIADTTTAAPLCRSSIAEPADHRLLHQTRVHWCRFSWAVFKLEPGRTRCRPDGKPHREVRGGTRRAHGGSSRSRPHYCTSASALPNMQRRRWGVSILTAVARGVVIAVLTNEM